MSDTPRMKAAKMTAIEHMTGDVYRVGCDIEQQLNAANDEIERLTAKVAQLYEGAEEAKQRIKRLKEAGDYLCAAAAFMGWHDKIEAWNKAKEAKP